MENRLLDRCLHDLMDKPPLVSLEGHPEFQSARRTAGDAVSLWRALWVILHCPALPRTMKVRQAVRTVVRH